MQYIIKFFKSYLPIILFFTVLGFECYFITERQWGNRIYSKYYLMPFLIAYALMSIPQSIFSPLKLFILIGIFCSWIADILCLQHSLKMQLISLGFYSISYFFYALIFFRVQSLEFWLNFRVAIIGLLLLILTFVYFYYLNSGFPVDHIALQFYGHSLTIIAMVVMVLNLVLNPRIRLIDETILPQIFKISYRFLIPAVILMAYANASFLLSCLYFYRKYSLLDAGVAFSYGLSQVLMVVGTRYLLDPGIQLQEETELKEN